MQLEKTGKIHLVKMQLGKNIANHMLPNTILPLVPSLKFESFDHRIEP